MKLKLVINKRRQVLNRCVPSGGIRDHRFRLERDEPSRHLAQTQVPSAKSTFKIDDLSVTVIICKGAETAPQHLAAAHAVGPPDRRFRR